VRYKIEDHSMVEPLIIPNSTVVENDARVVCDCATAADAIRVAYALNTIEEEKVLRRRSEEIRWIVSEEIWWIVPVVFAVVITVTYVIYLLSVK